MPQRARRVDAQRNRERLIETAASVIAEDGPDASLDKIATLARVGAGTLYRHFPSRSDLLAAVFEDRIGQLCREAETLAERSPPLVALLSWVEVMLDHAMTDNGLLDALALTGTKPAIDCSALILAAASALLKPAQEVDGIRSDVTPDDLLRLVIGIGLANDDRDQAHKLLLLTVDGLRHPTGADHPADRASE